MSVRTQHLDDGARIHDVKVDRDGSDAKVTVDEDTFELAIVSEREGETVVEMDGVRRRIVWARSGEDVWVWSDGEAWKLKRTQRTSADADADDGATRAELVAPMTGKVTQVARQAGDVVEEGDTVVVVEAMKMEHALRAPFAGTVTSLPAVEGAQVDQGDVLAVIEREDAEA